MGVLGLVPRVVAIHPNSKIDENRMVAVYPIPFVVVVLGYASSRVFRSILQGY
jgi:hypothetical protein